MKKFIGKLTKEEILVRNPNITGLEDGVVYDYSEGSKMFGNKLECEISRYEEPQPDYYWNFETKLWESDTDTQSPIADDYDTLRGKYIKVISECNTLGETAQATQYQEDWLALKAQLGY